MYHQVDNVMDHHVLQLITCEVPSLLQSRFDADSNLI